MGILNAGDEVRDIKKEYPHMSDNISTIYLHVQRCLILYTDINYTGNSFMVCNTDNLNDDFVDNVKSIQVDYEENSDYYSYLYNDKNQEGKELKINSDIPDTSVLEFNDFKSFMLLNKKG